MYQAFGLTYLIIFHPSALSNSRGAPCHCGLLFSLASISCNTGGLCLVQTETVSSPNKDKVRPEATVRGSGQNNHNYWRKGGEQGDNQCQRQSLQHPSSFPGGWEVPWQRRVARRDLMEEHVPGPWCSPSAPSVLPRGWRGSSREEWWSLFAHVAAVLVPFRGAGDWRSFLIQTHSVSVATGLLHYRPSVLISLSLKQG